MASVLDQQVIRLDRMERSSVRLALSAMTDMGGHSLT